MGICWGGSFTAWNCSMSIQGAQEVQATRRSFAAIRRDGTAASWGDTVGSCFAFLGITAALCLMWLCWFLLESWWPKCQKYNWRGGKMPEQPPRVTVLAITSKSYCSSLILVGCHVSVLLLVLTLNFWISHSCPCGSCCLGVSLWHVDIDVPIFFWHFFRKNKSYRR